MPPEAARDALTREWLVMAEEDLLAAHRAAVEGLNRAIRAILRRACG